MRSLRVPTAALLLGIAAATGATQTEPRATPQAALVEVLSAYASLTPISSGFGLSQYDAEEVQAMAVLNLRPRWGEVVGYKAALTSQAAQARFRVSSPVSAVLLENMFTSTGSIIDRSSAAFPLIEADLLVRVGDEAINDATDADQVLANLSQVIPFVEIPDLMFEDMANLSGPDITTINAGARLGVMGEPIAIGDLDDAYARLGGFSVELVDGDGTVLASGSGTDLMGHPLTAALWLKNDLDRRGIQLKAGDLLSLGSIGPPLPLTGLTRAKATYTGLVDRPLTIHVGFR
jgi:2-keto-4-pentenoate hydratase